MARKKLGTVTVDRWALTCERCKHKWEVTGDPPKSCAACKTRYWNVKRGRLPMGRPPSDKE